VNQSYDMKDVIRSIVDNGDFFEPHDIYAKNIIVGFARLNGRSIGIIANQPKPIWPGALTLTPRTRPPVYPVLRCLQRSHSDLCRCARLPARQRPGMGRHHPPRRKAALVLFRGDGAQAAVIVTRKDYGGAYIAMSSKHLGADMALAWPTAEIAVMGAEGAANIIHRRKYMDSDDPGAKRKEK
jgi:methylmalonyl-CoA decarboxylase subunit alpha